MNSVGEEAFLASRRASSCPLKGMFFIVKGHVLELRWVWSPPPNPLRKGVGHLMGQRLLWFYGCDQRDNKSGLEGQQEWLGGVIQLVLRFNKNGSMDGYKWFGGLTGKVLRVNKNGSKG